MTVLNARPVHAAPLSRPAPATAPVPADEADERSTRFVRDIIQLHEGLNYRNLSAVLPWDDSVYRARRGDLTITVAARTDQFPHRYLLGLAGFRLAQYLQLGYASAAVVAAESLHCEPLANFHPADLHCVTLEQSTGRLLGYVTLAHNGDAQPCSVRDAAARRSYPCEQAHGIDLFEAVSAPADLNTAQVREIKRFVRARSVHDRVSRLRVSLELLVALSRAIQHGRPALRALVGDVEPRGALRHLVLMGLQVKVVGGTSPRLSHADVMHPMYVVRATVEPFFSWMPEPEVLGRHADRLEEALSSPDVFGVLARHLPAMQGSVERIGERG